MKNPWTLALLLSCLPTLAFTQKPRLVVPVGHAQGIASVAFSPSGQQVLTGSIDGSVKLWDLSGRELQTFSGDSSFISSVMFSPDGQQVLTWGFWAAELWDLSGRKLQTFSAKEVGFAFESATFSPDGQQVLVWGSEAAQLWDLSGRKLHTFFFGDIASLVFSPDGQQILILDTDGGAKLCDLSGRVLQTILAKEAGFGESATFSPDGQQVLVWGSEAAQLWDLSGRKLHTFPAHHHRGNNWRRYSSYNIIDCATCAAFSPDGQQVLTCIDGTARLWDLSGRELQTFSGDSSHVASVAFSPDGQQVLTGFDDGTAKLWDLSRRELQTFSGKFSHVTSLTFSKAWQQVLTGFEDGTAKLWDLSGRELQTMYTGELGADYTGKYGIKYVAFSPDEQHVLTRSSDGTAKLCDLSGRELQTFSRDSSRVTSFAFSPSGQQVLTGFEDGTTQLCDLSGRVLQTFPGEFSIELLVFSPDEQHILIGSVYGDRKLVDLSGREKQFLSGGNFGSAVFSPDGQQLLTIGSTARLCDLSGRVLQTFNGESIWTITIPVISAVFSPDGQQVLTGFEDNTAKLWDLSGRELRIFSIGYSQVCNVAFSPSGQQVLTGLKDGTALLWDLSGKVLAHLIPLGKEGLVVLSPEGLFDASPGIMNQMYFVVGGQEIIELEQLKDRYYEPDLLAKILQYSSDPIREVSGLDSIALYPLTALQLDTLARLLHIQLTPRAGGVGKVSVFINGKEVISEANPVKGYAKTRDIAMTISLDTYARYFLTDTLNHITIRAYHAEGWLKSPPQTLDYWYFPRKAKGRSDAGRQGPALIRPKPALYVIAVGTSNYSGEKLDLKYPDQDARQMAAAFQQVGSQLFGSDSVRAILLTTDTLDPASQPTKTNIQAAFEAFKESAKAEDILVVYFSGHGVSYGDADQAQFYYLTKDISSDNLRDDAIRSQRTISNEELTQWVTGIPAQKQILILDACNSGRVVERLSAGKKDLNSAQIRALDRMRDRTGMFVLAGSAADMVSYEAGQYGQGLLTYSLLEGMSGLALTPDKRVDVSTLFEYSRNRVPELATGIGGVQTPMLLGSTSGSFDIGIVDTAVHISLSKVKPVFIRSVFQDEDNLNDPLGLTESLERYFQEITLKGSQAPLVFADVRDYPNGYSIKGLYGLQGDQVTIRARLFYGNTLRGEFKVAGRSDNQTALIEAIIDQVGRLLE